MNAAASSKLSAENLISKLESTSKRTKRATILRQHRFDWLQEHRRLLHLERHLQSAILKSLQEASGASIPTSTSSSTSNINLRRPHAVISHARNFNAAAHPISAEFRSNLHAASTSRAELLACIRAVGCLREKSDNSFNSSSQLQDINSMLQQLKSHIKASAGRLAAKYAQLEDTTAVKVTGILEGRRGGFREREVASSVKKLVGEVEEFYADEPAVMRVVRAAGRQLDDRQQVLGGKVEECRLEAERLREKVAELSSCAEGFHVERFEQLCETFAQRNAKKGWALQRLELEFPTVQRNVLREALETQEALRRVTQKMKEVTLRGKRVAEEEHRRLIKTLLGEIALVDERRQRQHVAEEQRSKILSIRKRLEAARKEYAKRQKVIEELKKQEAMHELEIAQGKEEAARRKAAIQKRLLESYRNQKEMEANLKQLAEDQEELEKEEQMKQQSLHNRQRVRYRAEEMQRKLEEKEEEAEAQRAQKLQLESELEALKSQVPYFQKLQEIVPNAERTRQRTFASAAGAAMIGALHIDDELLLKFLPIQLFYLPDAEYKNFNQEGLFKLKSFTSDDVCGDLRFRIIDKLRQRGLHQTPYALTLMRSMNQQQLIRRNMHEST